MRRFRFISFSAAMAAVWLISGCSSSTTAKSSDSLTEGKQRTTATADGQVFRGDGYSFTMPKSWKVVDLRVGEYEKSMEALKGDKNFADVEAMAKQAGQNKQVKMFAAMTEYAESDFAPNLNVIEMVTDLDMPAAKLFEENVKALKPASKTEPKMELRNLGSAEAALIKWDTDMMGKHLYYSTVIAWKNKTQYIFTFTTLDSSKDKAAPEIASVVDSIKFE